MDALFLFLKTKGLKDLKTKGLKEMRILPVLISMFSGCCLLFSGISWADVKNLDYNVRELETVGTGAQAEAALADAGLKALEEVLASLVQTEAEKQALSKIRPQLLAQAEKYLKRLKILGKGTLENGGRYYKVRYQVLVKELRSDLEQAGVIVTTRQLSEQLNYPTLMAYYNNPADRSEYAKWAVDRINHFLLEHQFKVVDAHTLLSLQKDEQVLKQAAGRSDRLSQAMALRAKADIYMRVKIDLREVGRSGDYTYVQSPVQVEAFESSAGIPFIVKTYQRLDEKGQPEALAVKGSLDISRKVVIEEAIAGVMPFIMQDLLHHWKTNVVKGRQYRLSIKGLKTIQQQIFEAELARHVGEFSRQPDGSYVVRFSGILGDLADLLEAALQDKIGLTIEQFDLGQAYFRVSSR